MRAARSPGPYRARSVSVVENHVVTVRKALHGLLDGGFKALADAPRPARVGRRLAPTCIGWRATKAAHRPGRG